MSEIADLQALANTEVIANAWIVTRPKRSNSGGVVTKDYIDYARQFEVHGDIDHTRGKVTVMVNSQSYQQPHDAIVYLRMASPMVEKDDRLSIDGRTYEVGYVEPTIALALARVVYVREVQDGT